MLLRKLAIILLVALTLISCKRGQIMQANQSVFLFKDKDGLYLYDLLKKKDTIIFKANSNQTFLDEPYELSGDTLSFGFRGEHDYPNSANSLRGDTYYKTYYSVDLKTGNNWVSKKIFYEVTKHDTLTIQTLFISPKGVTIAKADTSMKFESLSSTYKGITFNDNKPRFFSKSTVEGKSVYSLQGSIYLTDNSDTTTLVKYDGHFDPKFGSGYYQPRLDPKGSYVLFSYLPGFMNLTEKVCLEKVDIKTKAGSTIKTGEFSDPTFSNDGNFLLFKRNERQGNNDTWVSDIYILDLSANKEIKIGEAYSAVWTK